MLSPLFTNNGHWTRALSPRIPLTTRAYREEHLCRTFNTIKHSLILLTGSRYFASTSDISHIADVFITGVPLSRVCIPLI